MVPDSLSKLMRICLMCIEKEKRLVDLYPQKYPQNAYAAMTCSDT